MTSTLPTRPFVELLPPPDGLETVRRTAARRRRRKLAAAAGGGAGALAVVAAVLLSGGGGGIAVLQPVPPAGQPGQVSSPEPSGSSRVDGKTHVRRGSPAAVAGRRAGRAPAPGSGVVVAGVPSATDATPPPTAGTAPALQLRRWQSTYTGAPRECSGSTYGGPDNTFESSVGWCLVVTASPLSDGARLHMQLCRDTTGGGTLSFPGSREVDLAVDQGSRTVWDWAALHPGGSGAHQISANANGCWNWSLVWPDVAQDGSTAGHGTFTFVGTSTASEMKGKPDESVDFSY